MAICIRAQATIGGITYATKTATKVAEYSKLTKDEAWYIEHLFKDNNTGANFIVAEGGRLSPYNPKGTSRRFVIRPLSDEETQTWLANRNLTLSPESEKVQTEIILEPKNMKLLRKISEEMHLPLGDTIASLVETFGSELELFQSYSRNEQKTRNLKDYSVPVPITTREHLRSISLSTGSSYGYTLEKMAEAYMHRKKK